MSKKWAAPRSSTDEGGLAIEGSYDVSDDTCAGDIGSWRVVKTVERCDANGDGSGDRRAFLDALDMPNLLGVFPHRAIAGKFANAGHI
jgi:hypothetical protein